MSTFQGYPSDSTPGRILGQLLQDQSLSHAYSATGASVWPTTYDFLPDSDDTQVQRIACITTTPVSDGTAENIYGRVNQLQGVQVIVQASNDRTAFAKAGAIRDAMYGIGNQTITINSIDYQLHSVQLASGPIRLGRTEAGRYRYSVNYLVNVTTTVTVA